MRTLLISKHYQIFFILLIPILFINQSPIREIAFVVSSGTYFAWIYAIAVQGQKHIAALGLKPMNMRLFRVNMIVLPLVVWLRTLIILSPAINARQHEQLMLITAVISCLTFWQAFLFASKTLAKIERQREVMFGEYFSNFLQMVFILFGIWTIQPRVNRIFDNQTL